MKRKSKRSKLLQFSTLDFHSSISERIPFIGKMRKKREEKRQQRSSFFSLPAVGSTLFFVLIKKCLSCAFIRALVRTQARAADRGRLERAAKEGPFQPLEVLISLFWIIHIIFPLVGSAAERRSARGGGGTKERKQILTVTNN